MSMSAIRRLTNPTWRRSPGVRKHRGHYLVRAGAFESKEGANRSRHIVVEFPSYQAALDAYRSPEGQAAATMRKANADTNLLVMEGYDGPQPSE